MCAIASLPCDRCLKFFFFSSRRRHTRFDCDWSSDVCSSDLSLSCAFCGGPVGAICGEEVFYCISNFDDVRLRRKMSGIEELNLPARDVFSERLRSCGGEKGIVLAPDRKQGRLRFTEIFLKFRIKLYVRRVIQKQIELNLSVPRTLEQRRI